MRILLDMDETIVDLMSQWLRFLKVRYDEPLVYQDIKSFNIHEHCTVAKREEVYSALAHPGFFRQLNPFPGAIETINKWITEGHDVGIVTACQHGHQDKMGWLEEYLPRFNRRNLIFASQKHWVKGDVFVDDCPDNLIAYSHSNPKASVICMDHPWNLTLERPFYDHRARTWPELEALVEEIAYSRGHYAPAH